MLPLTRNPDDDMNGDATHNDDDDAVHDQLPSVEEIRHASSRSSMNSSGRGGGPAKKCRFGEVGIIALVAILIVTVIGLSVGVAKRGDQVEAAVANTSSGTSASPPPPPTPRQPREPEFKQWMIEHGISSSADLEKEGSPQKWANYWMADSDQLQLPLPPSVDSPEGVRFVSRYVAALLYYALNGSNWDFNLSFLSVKDVCEWNDIFVAAEGVQGRFFRIGLACNNGIVDTWQMRKYQIQCV